MHAYERATTQPSLTRNTSSSHFVAFHSAPRPLVLPRFLFVPTKFYIRGVGRCPSCRRMQRVVHGASPNVSHAKYEHSPFHSGTPASRAVYRKVSAAYAKLPHASLIFIWTRSSRGCDFMVQGLRRRCKTLVNVQL